MSPLVTIPPLCFSGLLIALVILLATLYFFFGDDECNVLVNDNSGSDF